MQIDFYKMKKKKKKSFLVYCAYTTYIGMSGIFYYHVCELPSRCLLSASSGFSRLLFLFLCCCCCCCIFAIRAVVQPSKSVRKYKLNVVKVDKHNRAFGIGNNGVEEVPESCEKSRTIYSFFYFFAIKAFVPFYFSSFFHSFGMDEFSIALRRWYLTLLPAIDE